MHIIIKLNYKFKKLPEACLSRTSELSDKKIFNSFMNILKSNNKEKILDNIYIFNPNDFLCDYYKDGFCDIYDKKKDYSKKSIL